MGILESGVLGPFHNKVGPAVGRKHMGQDLLQALPRTRKKGPSAKQGVQRDKFGLLNSFLNSFKVLVRAGFQDYAKKKSALNAACHYNYEWAFIEGEAGPELNYPVIQFSRGDVAGPELPALNFEEAGLLTFSWEAQPQSEYCRATDRASFLVYDATTQARYLHQDAASRQELSFSMPIVPGTEQHVLHCYMSFCSADGKKAGDSVYVEQLL